MAKIKGNGTGTATVKKSTKGIPRITDKVLAMDEAGRKAWFDAKCSGLSPEIQAEIQARMVAGRVPKASKKVVNFDALFAGKSLEVLTNAKIALDKALAETAVREEAELNAKIAALTQQKEALLSSRKVAVKA